MFSVATGPRPGLTITHRSSAPARTVFIRFSVATTLAASPLAMRRGIFGFATVWMIAMPPSRVAATLICAPMLVSLVAMNYHFVSDVIAGSVLGALVATYA